LIIAGAACAPVAAQYTNKYSPTGTRPVFVPEVM
jgi:hypothetical protein